MAFGKRLYETEGRIERLIEVFKLLRNLRVARPAPRWMALSRRASEESEDLAAIDAGLPAAEAVDAAG